MRATEADASPSFPIGWRHATCGLVCAIVFLTYADRASIGLTLAQTDFPGIAHEQKGNILSAFFVGYFCTQVLGGYLSRRLGTKPVLILCTLIWAFFDMLTPLAARFGVSFLLLARFGMGLGEGMFVPTHHGLCGFWLPTHERAFLMSLMSSGAAAGSMVAGVVSPSLVKIGLPVVFFFWGGLALLWCLVYAYLGASAPEVHARCQESGEAQWIQQHRAAPDFREAKLRVAARCDVAVPPRLLREPCIWGIFAGHVGVNYAWYVMLSWLPSFFKGAYGLDLTQRGNGLLVSLPYLCASIGLLCGGRLSDWLVQRGVRTRRVRKGMQLAGALGNALLLQVACRSTSPTKAAAWVGLAAFMGKFQNSGYLVSMVDVCPESAATVMGMSNMVATIPGILGQPITQWILSGAGGESSPAAWSIVFGVGGATAVLGALAFAALVDDVSLEKVEEEEEDVVKPTLVGCAEDAEEDEP